MIWAIYLYQSSLAKKSYSKVLLMEELIIRKAISKDQDRIFEIFESQDTKWDIPCAKRYYNSYFNGDNPDDMVFAGEIDGKIVSVTGYSLDKSETDDVFWLNWHYTHKDFEGQGIGRKNCWNI